MRVGQLEAIEPVPALHPRRRAPVHGDGPLQRGSLRGHRSRVVARIRLLLERPVMLLVDDDEPEPLDRSEDRRPCSDHDTCRARRDPLALVTALRVAQRRVEHGYPVTEALTEATDGLRRQSDLGHEHDDPSVALERRRRRLEVHLRLPAPGRAVQEDVAPAGVECRHDASDGVLLALRQLVGLGLSAERVAGGRVADRTTPAGEVRRDECERAGGRGAVVVREPERELDERRRNAIDDVARVRDHDAVRGRDARVDHDATHLPCAESDREHVALFHVVGDAVCERARQRARRHQRIDLRERHSPSVRRVSVVRRRRRRARSPYQSRGRGRAGLRRA